MEKAVRLESVMGVDEEGRAVFRGLTHDQSVAYYKMLGIMSQAISMKPQFDEFTRLHEAAMADYDIEKNKVVAVCFATKMKGTLQ